MPRRGDTQAPPGYFLPNHSSLFPKKPSPFHMGLYFQKVPTVNPSVKNQRFLPAPFSKGAFGAVPIPGKTGNENIRTMHALTASARRTFGMRCKKGACCKILTLQQAPFYTGNKNEAAYYRAEAESFLSRPLWVITTWRMVPSTSSTPSSPRATYRALSQKASPM